MGESLCLWHMRVRRRSDDNATDLHDHRGSFDVHRELVGVPAQVWGPGVAVHRAQHPQPGRETNMICMRPATSIRPQPRTAFSTAVNSEHFVPGSATIKATCCSEINSRCPPPARSDVRHSILTQRPCRCHVRRNDQPESCGSVRYSAATTEKMAREVRSESANSDR